MDITYLKKIVPLKAPTHIYLLVEGEDFRSSIKKLATMLVPLGLSAANFESSLLMQLAHSVSQEKIKKVSFPVFMGAMTHSLTIQLVKGPSVGNENKYDVIRNFGAQAVRGALQKNMLAIVDARFQTMLTFFIEGAVLGSFDLQTYKSKPKQKILGQLSVLLVGRVTAAGLARQVIVAEATNKARELVDTPAELCNSLHILERAKEIARVSKLTIDILDAKSLQKIGANGLLTVNKASGFPPFLIKLVKKGPKKGAKKIALVGKGVTFDTGGLCIKSAAGMEHMKKDMAGAAAVLYAMSVIGQSNTSAEVTAYLPIVENSINEHAMRPGDIYKSLSGKFVEVINTDAEGRLILIDALTLAEREGAEIVVDLATLTGACTAAIGDMYAGLFCRDVALAKGLLGASEVSGDSLWPLPFHAEYAKAIESRLADVRNSATFGPGASTAAHFLESAFAKKETRWAHVDMAGTASMTREVGYKAKGATGFGVRLLVEFVQRI